MDIDMQYLAKCAYMQILTRVDTIVFMNSTVF